MIGQEDVLLDRPRTSRLTCKVDGTIFICNVKVLIHNIYILYYIGIQEEYFEIK